MYHLGTGATPEELKWFQGSATSNSHSPACSYDVFPGSLLSCLSDFLAFPGPCLCLHMLGLCSLLFLTIVTSFEPLFIFDFSSTQFKIHVKSKFLTYRFLSLSPFPAYHVPYSYLVSLITSDVVPALNSSFICYHSHPSRLTSFIDVFWFL